MKKYETYLKLNNKWLFLGWYPMRNDEFCINTYKRGKYLYKQYKWLTGVIEEYRYGASCVVEF